MRRPLKAATALAATLAACSCVGPFEQLGRVAESEPNFTANAGKNRILIRNLFVIGPQPGQALPPGSTAPVHLTVINQRTEPDRLVSIAAPGVFQGGQIAQGGLEIRPLGLAGGTPTPQAQLTGLSRELRSGAYIPMELRFQRAGTIRTQVPVLPPNDWRATYSPWPSPG